jgi:hypothetical protein
MWLAIEERILLCEVDGKVVVVASSSFCGKAYGGAAQ